MSTIVKKKDMVTVYGTGNSKTMTAGKEYSVHSIVADKLIKLGYASRTPVDNSKGGKKGGSEK